MDSTAGPEDRTKRWVALIGGLAVTALLVYLAFLLGAWGFDTRRFSQHERRLHGLLVRSPTLGQVEQAFEEEGTRLLARPHDREELLRVAAERGRTRADDVVDKGTRWPTTRVFVAGDMVYFVFFDRDGVMRDYLIASR
jgi:hypothetical protein